MNLIRRKPLNSIWRRQQRFRIYSILKTLARVVSQCLKSPLFGFVTGHSYITSEQLKSIETCIDSPSDKCVPEFEKRFASLVGDGGAVSFASARMGFFALMKIIGIGPGDEVILTAATCSVMANAILRVGARPVYADIDPQTFGSAVDHISRCVTERTRIIVAQHSFGIPCDILPIVLLAKAHKLFLLEDCALALGSSFEGLVVGNFGDAAIFSTDRTKPLSTLIGGLVYTRNEGLLKELCAVQYTSPELPIDKQRAIWRRLQIERKYCNSRMLGRMALIDLLEWIKITRLKSTDPFLSEDFLESPCFSYPYPAKLPSFLAAIGVLEMKRWPQVALQRKAVLAELIEIAKSSNDISKFIPLAYFDRRFDIVPLRFVWSQPDGMLVRVRISSVVDVAATWFLKPIVGTSLPLSVFGYADGSCPISEALGSGMVNLPCPTAKGDADKLVKSVKALFGNVFLGPQRS